MIEKFRIFAIREEESLANAITTCMKAPGEEMHVKLKYGTQCWKVYSGGFNAVADNAGLSSFVWPLLRPKSVKSYEILYINSDL